MTGSLPTNAATGRSGVLAGRVAGGVLAAIRRSTVMTQEDLATRTGVSPAAVQGWEQGRKPLINVPYTRLHALRRELQAAGATADLLWLWDRALSADAVLAGLDEPDPRRHPLAITVPDRTLTELIAWPLSGQPPRQLAGFATALPVGDGELAAVTAALRDTADQYAADGEPAAMLRRQVKFLLAQASDPTARQWAADAEKSDLRAAAGLDTWTPRWPLARSAAVTAAATGNLDPLHRFIDTGLASDQLQSANLNYWAYWAGEIPVPWAGDSAMTGEGSGEWTGTRLLGSLLHGVVNAPYRDLCAHSLWALLLERPLAGPKWQPRIREAVTRAIDGGELAGSARQRLEQVNYSLRSR